MCSNIDISHNIIIIGILLALLQCCAATLDLSNLDVKSFRFFRYVNRLPNGDFINVPPPPASIEDHFNRAKAIAIFTRKLVLGNSGYDARSVPFVFNPNVEPLREKFQSKHGFRGERLVEQLGNGDYLRANYEWYRGRWRPIARHRMHSSHW